MRKNISRQRANWEGEAPAEPRIEHAREKGSAGASPSRKKNRRPTMNLVGWVKPTAFPALICLFAFFLTGCTKKPDSTPSTLTLSAVYGAYPAPPVRTFPSSSSTIQEWINAMDENSIRAHGWDIWESITHQTPDSTPVWET